MAAPVWPARSAGPHNPSVPLCRPLLRIVPGSPRDCKPVVKWIDQRSFSSHLQLHASCRSESAVIDVPPSGSTPTPNQWFDFYIDVSNDTEHISFELTTATHSYSTTFLSQEFSRAGGGNMSRALVDTNNVPQAILTINYLYITPYSVPQPSIVKTSFVPTFIGHRGMGSSGPHAPWRPLENSIESFLMATLRNDAVRTIELDVQLTRDNEVVVYHDWFFRPRDHTGHPMYDRESVKIPVHNLTFAQFNNLYKQSYARHASLSQQQLETRRIARETKAITDSCFGVSLRTLSEVCRLLPTDIGFLLEVKYPAPNVQKDLAIPYPPMNHYIDRVLDGLISSGAAHPDSERKVAFLSFHPDVCMMLSMKQNQFPVYFSHCEALDKPCDESDPRCTSLEEGHRFVKSQRLDGLMLLNRLIDIRPEVIDKIVADDTPIITYGSSNSHAEVVRRQFEKGVTGIIADDVDTLLKELQI
ncbi:unnamed protein product [Agarophyton chilense]